MNPAKTVTGKQLIDLLPQGERYAITDGNFTNWNVSIWLNNKCERTCSLYNPATETTIKLTDDLKVEVDESTFTLEHNGHSYKFTVDLLTRYILI